MITGEGNISRLEKISEEQLRTSPLARMVSEFSEEAKEVTDNLTVQEWSGLLDRREYCDCSSALAGF